MGPRIKNFLDSSKAAAPLASFHPTEGHFGRAFDAGRPANVRAYPRQLGPLASLPLYIGYNLSLKIAHKCSRAALKWRAWAASRDRSICLSEGGGGGGGGQLPSLEKLDTRARLLDRSINLKKERKLVPIKRGVTFWRGGHQSWPSLREKRRRREAKRAATFETTAH